MIILLSVVFGVMLLLAALALAVACYVESHEQREV